MSEMSDMLTECDYAYPDADGIAGIYGQPCSRPVQFYALSRHAPDLFTWTHSGGASIAGFCCFEHADAEPRPTFAAARRRLDRALREELQDVRFRGDVKAAWERLLDAYPDPIPVRPR
jgi:hypothetical protein